MLLCLSPLKGIDLTEESSLRGREAIASIHRRWLLLLLLQRRERDGRWRARVKRDELNGAERNSMTPRDNSIFDDRLDVLSGGGGGGGGINVSLDVPV